MKKKAKDDLVVGGVKISLGILPKLRGELLLAGISTEELARRCGVSAATMANLLSGNYLKPGLWRKVERVTRLPLISSSKEFSRLMDEETK